MGIDPITSFGRSRRNKITISEELNLIMHLRTTRHTAFALARRAVLTGTGL